MTARAAIGRAAIAAALVAAAGCRTSPAPAARPASGADLPATQPTAAAATAWDASGIDWSAPPPAAPEPAFRPPTPTRIRLRNGLDVWIIENHRLPLVSVRLIQPRAGAVHDPPATAGLAALTADLLDEGTGRRSALELAADLERLGAELDVDAEPDAMIAQLDALSANLDASLELMAAVVARPAFRAADFERVRADRLSALRLRRDHPSQVARLAFDQTLYGGDRPYGWPASGGPASVARIRLADVRAFHAAWYGPDGASLVVAGDVIAAGLGPRLEAAFGAWRSRRGRRARDAAAPAVTPVDAPPRLVLVHNPGAAQSVVHLGRAALPRTDERYYVADVLNTLLGGSFSSRLNHRLREQLGFTYGAGSEFEFGIGPGPWRARTALFIDKTIPGIKELTALVAAAATAPAPADELARVEQLRIRELPARFEGNAQVAAAFGDLALYRLAPDWYASYAERIAAVTAEQVRGLAAELLSSERLVLVVVTDLDAQRDALLGLGLRPAIELDADGALLKTY
jgi:predicted Zn-dependent peptidase